MTAPAAVETALEAPLTTFLIALFRRPSFLFLGASEEPEEEDPPDADEDPLEEDAPEEDPPPDAEEVDEDPPAPYLPLSYPFLAAPLTALAALCAVPTALAATPTPPCAALATFLTAPLTLESVDAFFSEDPPIFCLLTFSFALALAPASPLPVSYTHLTLPTILLV